MKKLHLIGGLPRSGSTLLCNIFNMNPDFRATSTSPVIDVVDVIRNTFSSSITARAQNHINELDKLGDGIKGFIEGYYSKDNVIFDKSRGWVNYLEILDKVLGHNNTKVIWLYRNPVEIFASIEKQYKKTLLLKNFDEVNGNLNFGLLKNRFDYFIENDNALITQPVWGLSDAINNRDLGHRIMIVTYDGLTTKPQETLNKIHKFIGEDIYNYSENNFKDLKQTTFEYDTFYNFKFPHTIKEGEIKQVKNNIDLPEEMIDRINVRFSWINDLINGN